MFRNMCSAFVFIMASHLDKRLSIGLTDDLVQAVWQDRQHNAYPQDSLHPYPRLVWYREFATEKEAHAEYARIAAMPDIWQKHMITIENPDWHDMWRELPQQPVILTPLPIADLQPQDQEPVYPVLRLVDPADPCPSVSANNMPPIVIHRRTSA